MLVTILLIVLLMLTAGLLAVAKRGFNEVIKGLESIDQRLAERQAERQDDRER